MNCVKMSEVSVDFHCIESRQWFEVLHSWQYEEFYDFTNCSESCQSVAVLEMRNFAICFTTCSESCQSVAVLKMRNFAIRFTICSESCQSVAVLVLTMRQQVREVHSFSQSPAAGCKHQQHNSSLLLSQCSHCFKPDCKHAILHFSQYIDSASSLVAGSTQKQVPFLQYCQRWAKLRGDRAVQAYSKKK